MRRTLALAASLLLVVSACGKDSTGPGGGGVTLTNGTFSGSINGTAYTPSIVLVTTSSGFTILTSGSGSGQGFAFGVQAAAPGTFTITQSTGNNAIYTEGNSSLSWVAGAGAVGSSGTITFTTLTTTRWVGTFSVILVPDGASAATGTKTITGAFDITY